MRLLSHLGAALISDDRVQRRNDTDAVSHHLVATLLVNRDTQHTLLSQSLDSILHPSQTLKQACCDDRLHHVQLQLTSLGSKAHGSIVADNLEANLVGNLRNHRVHLARHDRRSRSLRRKINLVQSAARTRSHQSQVVANLRQLNSQTLQSRRIANISASIRSSLHQVLSRNEVLARELAQVGSTKLGKTRHRIQSSTDSRTAHVDLVQQLHVALQVQNLLLQVVGISIKLLTESHRHSILQLGAPHLYRVVIFLSLIAESANQTSQSTYQVCIHTY